MTDDYDRLRWKIHGKVCQECKSEPRIAWLNGVYALRCNCYPEPPQLVNGPETPLQRYLRTGEASDAITKMQGERIKAKRGER